MPGNEAGFRRVIRSESESEASVERCEKINRSPLRGHDPYAGDRRGAEGRVGASGSPPRGGADGLRALAAPPESEPARSEMARPRPVRAVGRARLHAALLPSPPDRL